MSEDDTIEKFRKLADPTRHAHGTAPARPTAYAGEREPYVAYRSVDRPRRLGVFASTFIHFIPYGYMPIPTLNPAATHMIVTVSGMVLIVRGVGLLPVADAIGDGACEFIRQYEPMHFLEPTDRDAPIITSIESKLRHGISLEDE